MQVSGSLLTQAQRNAITGNSGADEKEYQNFIHNLSLMAQRGHEAIEKDEETKNLIIAGLKTFS